MKAFLALTSDRRFWNTRGEVVFLGDWCLAEVPDAGELTFPHRVLSSPWDRQRDLERVAEYLESFTDDVLAQLGDRLSAAHEIDYKAREWRILLGNWALHAVHALYDRFRLLEAALGSRGELWTRVPPPGDQTIPRTTEDFKTAQHYPDTALLLLGGLAETMGVACEYQATPVVRPGHSRYQQSDRSGFVRRLSTRVRRRLLARPYLSRAVVLCATGVSPATIAGLGVKGARIAHLSDWRPRRRRPVDMRLRQSLLADLAPADTFQRHALGMLPRLLPTSFLEDFSLWRSRVGKVRWGRRAKVLVTSYGFSGNELFSHRAVRFHRAGGRLVGMQHGGGYGSFRYCPEELHETKCVDTFVTWGWSADPRHRPLPSLYLSKVAADLGRKGPGAEKAGLLLVTSDRPYLAHRIQSHPLTGQLSRYMEWQERFYEALPGEAKRQFRLKLHADHYALAASRWWRKHSIQTVHGALTGMMQRFRLLVFDHNATGFLEALSLNLPTLVYWDPELWEVRDAAVPAFAELERAGIFHRSPESAAAQAGAVLPRVSGWWAGQEVQKARERFCHEFARTSQHWSREWSDFLRAESRLASRARP